MTEIEAYTLKPGDKLILKSVIPRKGEFVELIDKAMTVPLAMEYFKMSKIEAIKSQFDGPILIIKDVKGKGIWPAPRVKRPDVVIDIQCNFCQRHYDLQLPLEGFKSWMNGIPAKDSFPHLLDCEKEILTSQICGACKSK